MPSPADSGPAGAVVLPLDGEWICTLDPEDTLGPGDGDPAKQFRVRLPGSLDVQGIGRPVTVDTEWTGTLFDRSWFTAPEYAAYREPGNVRIPFFLQPETRHVGAARYRREFDVPDDWSGRPVELFLERPHGHTRIWLDDREIGTSDHLSTPHRFDLGPLEGGTRHRLTLRVDNRFQIAVGENAHSVSDHTQGNWNGVVGRIELRARGTLRIEGLAVGTGADGRSITASGRLAGEPQVETLAIVVRPRRTDAPAVQADVPVEWNGATGSFEVTLDLGSDACLWDEFNPALYEVEAAAGDARACTVTGLRTVAVDGTRLTINGRPVFLRGALDCCVFPLTGHPPMEPGPWRTVLGRIRDCGFNHVRFHSWCPPEAAFIAADELGLYFQVECGLWPNAKPVLAGESPAGIGDGEPVDDWAYAEAEAILEAYGNHPCFVLMACGNEPGGPDHGAYLDKWVAHFRARDPRRLYTGAAGWPELAENQFHVLPAPRLHQWGDGLGSRLNAEPPATVADYRDIIEAHPIPVLAHENGQWCAYPPLGDTGKYAGHLKARNYELFAAQLAAAGMADQLEAFVHASGKLQALCYKEEIETALRTPGMAGFQLLGLQDFPGQHTAPVGMLDAFWEEKPYIRTSDIRRFCGPTVPLARLPRRVYRPGERLCVPIEVCHFGPVPLEQAAVRWELTDAAGTPLREGRCEPGTIECGDTRPVGEMALALDLLPAPARYRLRVLIEGAGAKADNQWAIWLFPDAKEVPIPPDLSLATDWPAAAARLQAGERVLLLVPAGPGCEAPALGFTPIFWNTACTGGQAPHSLGILCDPAHPALAAFPTDSHSDWHWWYLVHRARALTLDGLPAGCRPVVQVIDDWYRNHRLGLLFEARVGSGRLLACSIDLLSEPESPEDAAVRAQFLGSLVAYAGGPQFEPEVAIEPDCLKAILNGS